MLIEICLSTKSMFFLLSKDCCFLDGLEYSGDFSVFFSVDFQCELFFIFYVSLMEAGVLLV